MFNTNCATYEDLLADPTYYGQILIQTNPLIGNRGVNPHANSSYASGYVVREWCVEPTDASEFLTLDEFLSDGHLRALRHRHQEPCPPHPQKRRDERRDYRQSRPQGRAAKRRSRPTACRRPSAR